MCRTVQRVIIDLMNASRMQFTIGALLLAMIWLGLGLAAHDQIRGLGFALWMAVAMLAAAATTPGGRRPL